MDNEQRMKEMDAAFRAQLMETEKLLDLMHKTNGYYQAIIDMQRHMIDMATPAVVRDAFVELEKKVKADLEVHIANKFGQ